MLVSLCLFAIASSTLAIQLENNSYKDVIIAINRDVEEDASLLQAIKDLVTDASPVLYHATRKRAYLGEVTIVIPDTWEDKPDYLAATTRETYRSAKVNVLSGHLLSICPSTYFVCLFVCVVCPPV